jgi:hypothetical protein
MVGARGFFWGRFFTVFHGWWKWAAALCITLRQCSLDFGKCSRRQSGISSIDSKRRDGWVLAS